VNETKMGDRNDYRDDANCTRYITCW